jgi:hypothetical protein
MRLRPASSAAAEKLANERVTPGRPSELVVKLMSSVPKKDARIVAAAELKVLWPDVYDGNGGVVISGVHSASRSVSALPSRWALRMPVIGRQKLVSYLAC